MRKDAKEWIKKSAGCLWILSVGLTFFLVYIVCSFIMNSFGNVSSNDMIINISAVSAIVQYVVLAIWGFRNL